jgi:hypothetical protein
MTGMSGAGFISKIPLHAPSAGMIGKADPFSLMAVRPAGAG